MKKPKREQDKEYLAWIKSLPCLVLNIEGVIGERGCRCVGDVAYHHVSTGGMGTKGSDYETVPLCNEHHRELHDKGKRTFQAKYQIDLKEEAERLRAEYLQESNQEDEKREEEQAWEDRRWR